jgi:excisionase family DNA binding protein
MKIKNQINQSIITAAVAMLSPFIPDLSPTRLIAALQTYDSEGKEQDILNARPRQPYTVAEVCKLFRISKPTVYSLAEKGDLTLLKIGRSTRIPADEVDALLNTRHKL